MIFSGILISINPLHWCAFKNVQSIRRTQSRRCGILSVRILYTSKTLYNNNVISINYHCKSPSIMPLPQNYLRCSHSRHVLIMNRSSFHYLYEMKRFIGYLIIYWLLYILLFLAAKIKAVFPSLSKLLIFWFLASSFTFSVSPNNWNNIKINRKL